MYRLQTVKQTTSGVEFRRGLRESIWILLGGVCKSLWTLFHSVWVKLLTVYESLVYVTGFSQINLARVIARVDFWNCTPATCGWHVSIFMHFDKSKSVFNIAMIFPWLCDFKKKKPRKKKHFLWLFHAKYTLNVSPP